MLSPWLAPFYSPFSLLGGGERDRTDDLLRAKQVLSQLSYTPTKLLICDCRLQNYVFDFIALKYAEIRIPKSKVSVVGLVGIEPTTSRLSGVRSNRD